MYRFRILLLIIFVTLVISGCGKRLTVKDVEDSGAPQLSGSEIRRLVEGSTLHFVSWDKADEANVIFISDGTLEGENRWGDRSSGRWKIDKNGKLCVKYKKWGSGYLSCYSVFQVDDTYKMFRVDGGLDTSFTVVSAGEGAGTASSEAEPFAPPQETAASQEKKGWFGSLWPWDKEEEKVATSPVQGAAEKEAEPFAPPQATSTPQETKKSWFSSLWPWGKEEKTASSRETSPVVSYTPLAVPDLPPLSADLRHLINDRECPECDLAGKNLSGIKLKGADLQGANLAGANLFQTNLKGANLQGANLAGANLELANLENAKLQGANLTGTRLVDTVLEDADLVNANLQGANLHWADAQDADLKNANLKEAYLVKTNFTDADLTGADLTDTVMQRTIFEDTKGYVPPEARPAEGEVQRVLEPLPKKEKKWWWPF